MKKKKVQQKNKKKSIKEKFSFKLNKQKILIFLMIGATILLSLIIFFGLYIIASAPKFSKDALYNKEATIIYDKNGKEIAKLGIEKRELVTYDDLPQVLVDAIIATEDSRFFQHNGFDIARFLKASFGQFLGDSGAGGASTLTMQVAKNNFTSTTSKGIKGIIRKFTDIYISIFKIEKNYTKEEIIEFYVNAPYLGNRTYGVEAASQSYFGKSISDLSLAEASLIAGLFQAPYSYNPYSNPQLATNRRSTVLNLMVKHGYITKEQRDFANSISVESLLRANNNANDNSYQGFIDTVVEEVIDRTGNNPYNIPMLIYSTMDRDAQNIINGIMNGETHEFVNDIVQMGIAVTDVNDGSIIAVGAGRNRVGERQFNFATMINRHPGSAAKPFFDYGPLIEYNNASPATYFFDEPYTYSNGQKITNADNKYRGMMSMRTALAQSRNIPALQAFQQVKAENITEFVHNVGINFGDTLYESASIGGFEGVSPVSLAAAYATFGRGGEYIEPYSFTKLIYRETEVTYEVKVEKTQAMSATTAFLINDILNYAVKNNHILGTLSVGKTDVAGKTGTSTMDSSALKKYKLPNSAIMDSWANIYSPDYSISIWYGYAKVQTGYYLTTTTGHNVRRKISQLLAKGILNTGSKWKTPKGIVRVEIELDTVPNMLPSEHTPESLRGYEYFKSGTEPTEVSWRFKALDAVTNLTANNAAGTVTLNWTPIATPDAISTPFLQNHYNENYGRFASKYYDQRLSYNNSNIGTIGYQVYLKDNLGNLTNLGFTTNSTFSYQPANLNTSLTFVVKSAYSIFKNNMSKGIETTVTATPSGSWTIGLDVIEYNPIVVIQGNSAPEIVSVLYNNEDIFSTCNYTASANNKAVSTLTPGNYTLKYNITCGARNKTIEYPLLIQ